MKYMYYQEQVMIIYDLYQLYICDANLNLF